MRKPWRRPAQAPAPASCPPMTSLPPSGTGSRRAGNYARLAGIAIGIAISTHEGSERYTQLTAFFAGLTGKQVDEVGKAADAVADAARKAMERRYGS